MIMDIIFILGLIVSCTAALMDENNKVEDNKLWTGKQ